MGTTFPGWLSRDDIDYSSDDKWSITHGAPTRGSAWTDIDNRRMQIPRGDTPLAEAVRAHELMHARISPRGLVVPDNFEASADIVAAAEEVRVNYCLKSVGIDVDPLADGSERASAEYLVNERDAAGLASLITSTYGTKVNRSIMTAVTRSGDAAMVSFAKSVRDICKMHTRHWGAYERVSDTQTISEYWSEEDDASLIEYPRGYGSTLHLARAIGRLISSVTVDGGIPRGQPTEDPDDPLPGGEGGFAPLRLVKLPMPERVAGRLGRRRIATNVGINPRRISRMLTDDERRIFDRRARGLGGVVLIDQSGSMALDTDDIWEIIKAAPGCTIIGYSHRAGSHDIPNTWVMAEGGRVVSEVPDGNVGNGVDGPALLFALTKRKKGQPFIWVCDGQVTDSDDNGHTSLSKWCGRLVTKHKIHMVEDTNEAVEALKRVARGEVLPAKHTGILRYHT
jgi:hypothetical protein